MRKLTLAAIRRGAWQILTKEVTVINLVGQRPDTESRCEYDEHSLEIWVDDYKTRLDYAVVHELIHKLLDRHFDPVFNYWVSENFIVSLEKPFFKRMSNKELSRWRRMIRQKIVRKRR